MKLFAALASMAAVAAAPAVAQTADWQFAASVYAWTPAISSTVDTGRFGSFENDMSIGDVLGDLEIAAMGAFEARRDRWALVGDLVYSSLSTSNGTPGRLFEKTTLDTTLTALTGYAMYRINDPADPVRFEAGLGFRAFWVDLDLDLKGNVARDRSYSSSDNWIDPLVVARVVVPFDEKWFGTALADLGGTGSDDRTWQALASVGYRFNESWSAQAAFRYLRFEHEIGGLDTTMEMYGPLIGATYRF